MEKYKILQEDIENATNHEVIKRTQLSVPAIIMLCLAVLTAVGGLSYEDPNSVVPSFLFTASACLFLAGIIKLLLNRNCYFFRPTKSKIEEMTVYFNPKEGMTLQTCMEMKRFDELKRLKREKDSGIKVKAMLANDRKFVAVQISEYVPYSYEAVTPVMCYYGEEARSLASYMKS